jgi:hypothetical protein
MQKWEYKVFASHLDPAELVLILDESGRDGWELVAIAAVVEYTPIAVIDTEAAPQVPKGDQAEDVVPTEVFRYIFKRPL